LGFFSGWLKQRQYRAASAGEKRKFLIESISESGGDRPKPTGKYGEFWLLFREKLLEKTIFWTIFYKLICVAKPHGW